MSEVALSDTTLGAAEASSRAAVLKRLRASDILSGLTRGAALTVLALLSGVILSLVIGSGWR